MTRTKLALFDIDKTITKHDSMLLFLKYGIANRPRAAVHLTSVLWNLLLYKTGRIPADKAKEAFFCAINYMDEADLEAFYDKILANDVYEEAVEEIRRKYADGYHVLLVTASPHAYMKYFKKLGCVHEVIGTQLEKSNDRYTSRIIGANCKADEKVVRIRQYVSEQQITIDYESSCAYSDCLSDLPMLQLVKHRYVVNRASEPSYGLEERRWNR